MDNNNNNEATEVTEIQEDESERDLRVLVALGDRTDDQAFQKEMEPESIIKFRTGTGKRGARKLLSRLSSTPDCEVSRARALGYRLA
tara:strand:- start:69 stop:329 length:261 start_codon:yes stop_codon:yes gene_type:complete